MSRVYQPGTRLRPPWCLGTCLGVRPKDVAATAKCAGKNAFIVSPGDRCGCAECVPDVCGFRPLGRIEAVKRGPAQYGAPAAVLDVGWVNGLAAIRSLGRAGIRVLAVDHRPSALGFRSRYAERFLSPDPHQDETRFVAFVRALGQVVVFPTHDEQLNLIARHLGDLDVLAPFPAWDILERVQSKRVQLEEAEAAGVDIPRTAYPGTVEEAGAAAKELGFPLLVKPEHPIGFKQRFRRQAFRCENQVELAEAYERASDFALMLQELIPGG